MKKLFVVFLVLVLAACSIVPASEFDQNLGKWQNADVSHYRFDLSLGCFCAFRSMMPLTIEVKNGEVVAISDASGIPLSLDDPNYEFFEQYLTIDRLFTALEADLGGEADEVTVTYEPLYGFPVDISIDRIKEAVDDELYIQVSNFEALQ
jgi:hypothetical protein